MTFKLTSFVALAVIGAVAISSVSFGQKPEIASLKYWVKVKPTIWSAFAARNCDKPGALAVIPVKIKVGQPYSLGVYNLLAKLSWTGALLWKPNRAVARRTFELFNIADLTSRDWQVLRDEFSHSPAMMAIVVPYGDGYIGTPVKWNKKLASGFAEAFAAATKNNDSDNMIVKAMAGELFQLGASSELLAGVFEPTYSGTVGIKAQKKVVSTAVQAYDCGKIAAVAGLRLAKPVFMGFSKVPDNFDVDPIRKIITLRGGRGQPLGTVMPSWPREPDSPPKTKNIED